MHEVTGQSEPEDRILIDLQFEHGTFDADQVLALVTPDWVSDALATRYPGAALTGMAVTRIAAGCSTKIWIKPAYNDAGRRAGLPETLIVKAGFDRHDAVMLFTYEQETLSYREVLPRFPVHAPICFYAGPGPNSVASAIIMEDLCPRAPRFCHASRPLSPNEAGAFVDAIAAMHARAWNSPILSDGSWAWPRQAADLSASLGSYFNALQAPPSWARYIALPRGQAISTIFHDRERFMASYHLMLERQSRHDQTILIGDCHLGNLFIEQDGTPGFLDFQCRVASWAQELSYFIGAGLDMDVRRAVERDLVVRYLDRLREGGVAPPSFDDAWSAYCEAMLFGLFVWITNGEHFQTEAVNTANAARLAAAARDLDTLERLAG